jgi:flagellar biosynthesis protein FlhG
MNFHDQASALRTMATTMPTFKGTEPEPSSTSSVPSRTAMRCLAFTSGKGGVGKSNMAVNVALELGELGNSVTLLDADFGLANLDLICGIEPIFHLGHVIAGAKRLDDITIRLSANVGLVPGGTGIEELANYRLDQDSPFYAELGSLESTNDFMLIDTGAGIAENVIGILKAAAEVVVVVTPDPTSIVDAYATIKVLLRNSPDKPISIVVNNIVGIGEGDQVFQQIRKAVRNFLHSDVQLLGMVGSDSQLQDAVREQVPVTQLYPQSPASRAIRLIARQLDRQSREGVATNVDANSFWEMLAV